MANANRLTTNIIAPSTETLSYITNIANWQKVKKAGTMAMLSRPPLGTSVMSALDGTNYTTSGNNPYILTEFGNDVSIENVTYLDKYFTMPDGSSIKAYLKRLESNLELNNKPKVFAPFEIRKKPEVIKAYWVCRPPINIPYGIKTDSGLNVYANTHNQSAIPDVILASDENNAPNMRHLRLIKGEVFSNLFVPLFKENKGHTMANEIMLTTPHIVLGNMIAYVAAPNSDYPGIRIDIRNVDGSLTPVATVEYYKAEKQYHVHAYMDVNSDSPTFSATLKQ